MNCKGYVIFLGMGKLGYVGCKMLVMLVFMGMFSFFIYFIEVFYGDLGMIMFYDFLIFIFVSGEMDEIFKLVFLLKNFGNWIIVIINNGNFMLVKNVDVVLEFYMVNEICLNNFVLIMFIMLMMVIGDVLVIVMIY